MIPRKSWFCKVKLPHIYSMLEFKRFLTESELAPVNLDSGKAELARLERSHYFFVLPTDHNIAHYFMNGQLVKASFLNSSSSDSSGIERATKKLSSPYDSLLIVCFPKRWETKLGRGKNIKELFANMFGEYGQSARYVWGMYSLWNPRIEDHDEGHFFRNPNYHADDMLLNKWLEKHAVVKEKEVIPLNRQPRVMGHQLLAQGRPSFHGWKEPELPSL